MASDSAVVSGADGLTDRERERVLHRDDRRPRSPARSRRRCRSSASAPTRSRSGRRRRGGSAPDLDPVAVRVEEADPAQPHLDRLVEAQDDHVRRARVHLARRGLGLDQHRVRAGGRGEHHHGREPRCQRDQGLSHREDGSPSACPAPGAARAIRPRTGVGATMASWSTTGRDGGGVGDPTVSRARRRRLVLARWAFVRVRRRCRAGAHGLRRRSTHELRVPRAVGDAGRRPVCTSRCASSVPASRFATTPRPTSSCSDTQGEPYLRVGPSGVYENRALAFGVPQPLRELSLRSVPASYDAPGRSRVAPHRRRARGRRGTTIASTGWARRAAGRAQLPRPHRISCRTGSWRCRYHGQDGDGARRPALGPGPVGRSPARVGASRRHARRRPRLHPPVGRDCSPLILVALAGIVVVLVGGEWSATSTATARGPRSLPRPIRCSVIAVALAAVGRARALAPRAENADRDRSRRRGDPHVRQRPRRHRVSRRSQLPTTLPGPVARNIRRARARWLRSVCSLTGRASCADRAPDRSRDRRAPVAVSRVARTWSGGGRMFGVRRGCGSRHRALRVRGTPRSQRRICWRSASLAASIASSCWAEMKFVAECPRSRRAGRATAPARTIDTCGTHVRRWCPRARSPV